MSELLTDDQIKHMVNRFLGWRLPEDFNPDGGISFDPVVSYFGSPEKRQQRREPVGTNLLTATQANAMVRYMLDGLPSPAPAEVRPDVVKAVARAIVRAHGDDPDQDVCGDPRYPNCNLLWEDWAEDARIALAALAQGGVAMVPRAKETKDE